MFRLYEFYSLYLKKMPTFGTSPNWCLCEKLPRSILHIAPPRDRWCEVCGRRRRPRACRSSSSDEEEKAAMRLQEMLAERRRAEIAAQNSVRVKVAMSATKPKRRVKGPPKKPAGVEKSKNNKMYMGHFGYYRKPQGMQAKFMDKDDTVAAVEQFEMDKEASAPPPTPSPPLSPNAAKAGESLWEQPNDDMPKLVAFAHDIFNRPQHLRKLQSSFYDNVFVSDFIPLEKPITNVATGAISKRRRIFGPPLRRHYSAPLPPLSQVLSDMLARHTVRAKGGGLPPKEIEIETDAISQFSPFDCYEGPSEDALVTDSARLMLHRPNALQINHRSDLPNCRLSSFESDPNSECSSSPFEVLSAPPIADPVIYTVGAPLRLHDTMKVVAQSGQTDSSASSSSARSTISSPLALQAESPRSRGGEDPLYIEEKEEKPADIEGVPNAIMEKILWLIHKKPEANILTHNDLEDLGLFPKQDKPIESNSPDDVEGMLQLMESLHIHDGGDGDDMKNNEEEGPMPITVDTPLLESNQFNDMSNQLPFNFNNKSAGDAKYVNVFSNPKICRNAKRGVVTSEGQTPNSSKSPSMWSFFSGLFVGSSASACGDEMKPLKSAHKLHYGTINGSKLEPSIPISNQHCQKCGLHRKRKSTLPQNSSTINWNGTHKPGCMFHSRVADSNVHPGTISKTTECMKTPQLERENVTIHIDKKRVKNKHMKSEQLKNNLFANVKNEPAKGSSGKESANNSSYYETCFEITQTVKSVEKTAVIKPRRNRRVQVPKGPKPIVYHKVQSFELVQYACSELNNPKMLAIIKDVTCIGKITEYIVSPAIKKYPRSIFEFRTTDVRAKEVLDSQKIENNEITESKNLPSILTPVAHSETSEQTEESSANSSILEKQRLIRKNHNLPVWPAHPFRHRKRHIKSKVQISQTVSDENQQEESHKTVRNRKGGKNTDMWIGNKLVQQKINEMMTKPIKLLTSNEATAASNPKSN